MKRKLFALLTVLCILTGSLLFVRAASSRLVDNAGVLSNDERTAVEQALDAVSTRQGMDIVIVTVNDTGNRTPMQYADDYYDYYGYSTDGILLLISMEGSDWWISTKGYGITAITDAGVEYISGRFLPSLSEGNYGEAFLTFCGLCDQFITRAKSGDPYDSHNLPKAPFRPLLNLGIALAVGLTAAFIVTGSMKAKLKSVRQQAGANAYVAPGSLYLTRSRDLHLYTHLDRREKASSGSGSSTHTSSSGATHGGGGGKF